MTPVCAPVETNEPSPARFSTRAQIVLGSCLCGGAAAFLFAVDPSRHAVYPQCFLYQATGIYCAGCGATRALYALLHGNLLQALHDNVLFVAALPVLAWLVGRMLSRAWKDNQWPKIELPATRVLRIALAIFAVMVVFMVLRNLPGWPFDLLRPMS